MADQLELARSAEVRRKGVPISVALSIAFIAVVVVLFWNFIVNRLWTYSDVQ